MNDKSTNAFLWFIWFLGFILVALCSCLVCWALIHALEKWLGCSQTEAVGCAIAGAVLLLAAYRNSK